ncbi:MAG: prolyl aminopeptidase [Methylococcaceae bacterium]|nr:prolyl aminopeptidase [Methylococcaceae bacterium]
MKALFPPIEPYAVHSLVVDGGHSLYVEECGNPAGIPVIFLHGGPGSGCKPYHRSFFDPQKYRIVLLDQRGSGRSVPHGSLENNTTAHLLADLEGIRIQLDVERWLLFGGSWGAALALLYAQQFPQRISGMVLRGSFLARQGDLDWYVVDGANRIYPERWAELLDSLQGENGGDLIGTLHEQLHGEDELAQRRVARAWSRWGGQVALGSAFKPSDTEIHVPVQVLHQAWIELHYAFHRYFIEENQILRDYSLIPEVPIILLHGRLDLVCPVEAAFSLQRHLPWAQLRILPNSGHIAGGAEMIDALVMAAEEMAERLA